MDGRTSPEVPRPRRTSEGFTALAGAVITMTDRGVLHDQLLRIDGGKIVEMRPLSHTEADGSAATTRDTLDWRHLTVIPGLADCHVHVEERADMLLSMAHGVTMLRNMRGSPWHLRWQQLVAAGEELGPHLVTATPMADGRGLPGTTIWPRSAMIDSAAAAHDAVRRWAGLGYQQLKAYGWLDAATLRALGDACREHGMPLVGHCPQSMTVEEAIDCGQSGFEHLFNYEYGALRPAARARLDELNARGFSYEKGINRFSPQVVSAACDLDESRLIDVAQHLSAEQIVSCPTLIVFDGLLGRRDFSEPRLRYVDPATAQTWRSENDFRLAAVSPDDLQSASERFHERGVRILAALRDAGSPMLVGTDAAMPFVFHGSAVVEEMVLMTEAGYTPGELLEMATRTAAEYLGASDRGRIDVGCVADLVVVEGDPLRTLDTLRVPSAVVVNGTVLLRPELDAVLTEAETLLHAVPDGQRLNPSDPGADVAHEYRRTDFGEPAGVSRLSRVTRADDTTSWHEQLETRRHLVERSSELSPDGSLIRARLERHHAEGIDRATAEPSGDGGYLVRIRTLDGAELETTIDGPVVPGIDIAGPAVLAACTPPSRESRPVLTFAAAFANSLAPRVGTLSCEADHVLEHTTDVRTTIAGNLLDGYTISASMQKERYEPLA